MDFRQLEAFVAVVELGSFSKAGEKLFLTQPTISAHIQSLEKELDQPLLVRSSKTVYANDAGKKLLDYAVRLLRLREEAVSAMALQEPKSVNIDIASSIIPAKYVLPGLISGFRTSHPQVSFTVSRCSSELIEKKLLSGEANLGFSADLVDNENCFSYPVGRDELVIITPNTEEFRQRQGRGFTFEELYEYTFVAVPTTEEGRLELEKYWRRTPEYQRLHIGVRVYDMEMLVRSVEEGVGISVVSKYVAANLTRFGRVLQFPFARKAATRNLYMVRLKKNKMALNVREFIDYVLEHGAETV